MGFGGKDGCVQGDSVVAGGCDREPVMFGECPMHPGQPMLDCATCKLLKLSERTCARANCPNRVNVEGTFCSQKCYDMVQEQGYEHVNHPKHYNLHPTGIEAIDIIEEMPFNVGTAMKYLWRAGLKPGNDTQQDLDKALWYINREKERLAKREGK